MYKMKMTAEDMRGFAKIEGITIDERQLIVGNNINVVLVNPITKEEETMVVEIVEPSEKRKAEPRIPSPGKENVPRISETGPDTPENPVPAKSIPQKIILVVSVVPMTDE